MNLVVLMGRLCADPEIRQTSGPKPLTVARYRLAVDRKYKRDGEQQADFINCVAFGKSGDFVEKYLSKGVKIAIEGHIQTGSYTDGEGRKVYTFDVVVEAHHFCESKKASNDGGHSYSEPRSSYPDFPAPAGGGFAELDDDEELPF